jgi:hypothetical protein
LLRWLNVVLEYLWTYFQHPQVLFHIYTFIDLIFSLKVDNNRDWNYFILVIICVFTIQSAFLTPLQPKDWSLVWKPQHRIMDLFLLKCPQPNKSQFLESCCVFQITELRSGVQRWLVWQPLRYQSFYMCW